MEFKEYLQLIMRELDKNQFPKLLGIHPIEKLSEWMSVCALRGYLMGLDAEIIAGAMIEAYRDILTEELNELRKEVKH